MNNVKEFFFNASLIVLYYQKGEKGSVGKKLDFDITTASRKQQEIVFLTKP